MSVVASIYAHGPKGGVYKRSHIPKNSFFFLFLFVFYFLKGGSKWKSGIGRFFFNQWMPVLSLITKRIFHYIVRERPYDPTLDPHWNVSSFSQRSYWPPHLLASRVFQLGISHSTRNSIQTDTKKMFQAPVFCVKREIGNIQTANNQYHVLYCLLDFLSSVWK